MKTVLLSVLAASLVVTGCSQAPAKNPDGATVAPAATFKAQRGIHLSRAATQALEIRSEAVVAGTVNGAGVEAAIPAAALLRTVKGDFVYVTNGDAFLRTAVTVGLCDRAWFEVKAGLYEGDRIVVQGTHALWLAELQATNGGVGCADDN